MYPKQGADHEKSCALQYSDLLGQLEKQIAAVDPLAIRDAQQRTP